MVGATLAKNVAQGQFSFRGPGHKVFTNGLGCFDDPVDLATGQPYILAIGDSFTWGYAPLHRKWTTTIQSETGYRVLKCGVSATGSHHQLQHTPLAMRLRAFFYRYAHYLGEIPELPCHLFDVHWTPKSDEKVAHVMIERLRMRGYFPLTTPRATNR